MTRALMAITLALPVLSGCIGGGTDEPLDSAGAGLLNLPVTLPATDFYNATGDPGYLPGDEAHPFHTLEQLDEHIQAFVARRPDLVRVEVIGQSLQGRPLYDVIVTNLSRPGPKPQPFFDGGHHANELLGTELALYTIDFLLDNYDRNATVRAWVDTLEIHTVPLVNPDGYVMQTRGNALGVNLNRNYDIDWGNPLGASNFVMGTVAHALNRTVPSVPVAAENSGPFPFSEPETRAIRDRLETLHDGLVFYMTYHTPTNGMIAPWGAYEAPFPVPPQKDAVLWDVLGWVENNTEYLAGKARWGDFSAGLPYSASGTSMDWAYMRHDVPAFTLEIEIWYTSIFSPGYAERVFLTPYNGLDYWLRSALPIPLYLLANAHALATWESPTADPPLPEGVPPERPPVLDQCEPIPHDEAPSRTGDPVATCAFLAQPGH